MTTPPEDQQASVPMSPASAMSSAMAAHAASLAQHRPEPLEFDDDQRRALTSALFDAQLAALRAISSELGRGGDWEVRRSVMAYTAVFAQLRGAAGQLTHPAGWFGYPPYGGGGLLGAEEFGET